LDHELRNAVQTLREVVQTMATESMTDEEALAVFNLLVEAKRISATAKARFAATAQLD
jgi:hypothetical protein